MITGKHIEYHNDVLTITHDYMEIDMLGLNRFNAGPDDFEDSDEEDNLEVPNDPVDLDEEEGE